MASLAPQQRPQRVSLNDAIPQQQQAQQPQHQVQPQPQLQYAPQQAQAPVAALQQSHVARSPTVSRKPVGQKAVVRSNTVPLPISRSSSVASAPMASQQHTHVQAVGPSAFPQQYQTAHTTSNAHLRPIQQLQVPVKGAVVQRPTQIQHQPLQQPQLVQQRHQHQALQQPQQTQTTQHSQSAGAFLHFQNVQQTTGAMPPASRRSTMQTLQPQLQQPQLQQSGNRILVQRAPSYASTTRTGSHSVLSGPNVMTPSTGPTTPGTPNLTSSHSKPVQAPNNTGRPIQQQPGISILFCNHCKTGIPSNVSTYTCLICSTANTPTHFCVWCFTSGAAATSHPHDKAYYVTESDLRIQLAPNSGVPTHLWTSRRNVTGTMWYTHNASGYKTHIMPHTAVVGNAGLAPGWDERRTPDGKTFFFNSATKATSWVRPLNSLPQGWKEVRTPDLVPFYVHEAMALASWERPGQQPKGRRSNTAGRPGTSHGSDSFKKMWGKLGKAKNLNKMAKLATTVNNLADGNFEPEEGDAEGDFEEATVEEETVEEYAGQEFGGEVQHDVHTEVYADGAAFQQDNFASQQEQPLYIEASETVQQPPYEHQIYGQQTNEQPTYEQPTYEQPNYEQPVYEQPVYEQPVYEQPVYEQPVYEQPTYEQATYEPANNSYQQPTYETGQQSLLTEPVAQSPLTNDASHLVQQPQPEPCQLDMTQEPLGVASEQEPLVQSQSFYTSPAPGILEDSYQSTVQQEVMLNQPTTSLAQSQVPPMHHMLESTEPTQQPALAFTPDEPPQAPGYTQPAPGVLETPYQTPIQQELVPREPAAVQLQPQEAPMQQMAQPTALPAVESTPPFAPQEQIQMTNTPGNVPQEQQQIIVNNEVTIIEAESNVTNHTAQVVDNSQLDVANVNQTSLESNMMVDNSQYNPVNNEQEVFINNDQFNTMNEIHSNPQTNLVEQNLMVDNNIDNSVQNESLLINQTGVTGNGMGSEPSQIPPIVPPTEIVPGVESAKTLPGSAAIEPKQIQGETVPTTCDISSPPINVQATDTSAQDAASRPFLFEPILAAEPMVSPPAEQNGVIYSPTLVYKAPGSFGVGSG